MSGSDDLSRLLSAIEHELRRIDLWSSVSPPEDALASNAPFCYDTLALHEWLQWVLLPRMKAIIEGGLQLPEHSGIAPLGEQVFPDLTQDTDDLLLLLRRFDEFIEGHGE
ncbi:MAG: YqcC family protein [Chromatiales bacterium]|nr:YqcC family protein [Chromatiales bacterium]